MSSSRVLSIAVLAVLASCDAEDVNEGSFVIAGTARASIRSGGVQADGNSDSPALSRDGRYVVFVSKARNLVPPLDTLGNFNVFRHDRLTRVTVLVSIGDGGAAADGDSQSPSISGDGRFVTFHSAATNLLPVPDTLGNEDIFLRDLDAGTTLRVSESIGGGEPDGVSQFPVISDDGRYVAFESVATDLIVGDTNGLKDVFRRAVPAGAVDRVSVSDTGAEVSVGSVGGERPAISADGSVVAFPSDCVDMVAGKGAFFFDIFVHDFTAVTTERVSIASVLGPEALGNSSSPSISADGRFVAFSSDADNLLPFDSNGGTPDVFRYDRQTSTTLVVSVSSLGVQANQASDGASISADGRSVVFYSAATNLVSGDANGASDVFLRDLQRGSTILLSVVLAGQGSPLDGALDPALSADGRFAAFRSLSGLLVSGDTNGLEDIFVRGPLR